MPEMLMDGTGSGNLVAVTAEGRMKVDLGGDITISGVSIDSITVQETNPIDDNKNNAAGSLIYIAGGNLVGSIVATIDAESFVNVLTYSGANNVLVNIGSWSQL